MGDGWRTKRIKEPAAVAFTRTILKKYRFIRGWRGFPNMYHLPHNLRMVLENRTGSGRAASSGSYVPAAPVNHVRDKRCRLKFPAGEAGQYFGCLGFSTSVVLFKATAGLHRLNKAQLHRLNKSVFFERQPVKNNQGFGTGFGRQAWNDGPAGVGGAVPLSHVLGVRLAAVLESGGKTKSVVQGGPYPPPGKAWVRVAGPGREASVRYNNGRTTEELRPGTGQGCFQTGSATVYRCGTGRLRLVVGGSFRGAAGERLHGSPTAGRSHSGDREPHAVFVGEVLKNPVGGMQARDNRRYATGTAVPACRRIFQGLVSRQGILGFTAGGGFQHPPSGGRVLKLPQRVDYRGAENNSVRKPPAGRETLPFPPVQMFAGAAYLKNNASAVLPDGAVS
ncbi:MAG: hypothetical protein AB1510_13145, partial [Bacillota bacterium]